jgi:hypothetical protein
MSGPELRPGPWLTVMGMHRSGTSAVTGALGGLGFALPVPDDRMDWPESNPEHWESSALTAHDDRVLAALGGSWDAPPVLSPGWEHSAAVAAAPHPAAAVRSAYPGSGPLVWKDPRLCLLLPYWRRFLPEPHAAVLVWRSPLSVARSLLARDGTLLPDGLALWERYNRAALQNLADVDTYVCSYEQVLADPVTAMTAIADWLGDLPQFAGLAATWDPVAAAATIDAGPARPGADDDQLLLSGQQALVACLQGLEGGHRPLGATAAGDESPWTGALLAARRATRTREVATLENQIGDGQRELQRLRASTSWRVTRPLRAVTAAAGRLRSRTRAS